MDMWYFDLNSTNKNNDIEKTKEKLATEKVELEKTIAEITVEDVLRMIRQKEFTNLAVSKAINFLKEEVFHVIT